MAEPPTSKQDTIEEEGDVSTVESAVDVPVQEESENSNPAYEKSDVPTEATKDLETSEEEADKEQSSFAGCCHGSPADVLKNLQAAVGMA